MGDIVNLRQLRKLKRRDEAGTVAAANRLRFGRTRAERELEALEGDRAARLLDGARLDASEPQAPGAPTPSRPPAGTRTRT